MVLRRKKIPRKKKEEAPPQQTKNDLFNNPMVTNAFKAMTPQQRADYKKIGEKMYGSVDFEDSKIINQMPEPLDEAALYIKSGLDSGLLPEDLDANDKEIMTQVYGPDWMDEYK